MNPTVPSAAELAPAHQQGRLRWPVERLKAKALDIRRDIVTVLVKSQTGHSGGPLSCADFGTALTGLRELYRGSKAALDMFMRSFAARHAKSSRTMVLMAPGWVRTALGGPEARLTIEESVPGLVNVLLSKQGTPGVHYVGYLGRTVPR